MDVRVGLSRKLSADEELMLLNSGVGEDSWEDSLDCKEIQPVHPKGDQSWVFISRTDFKAEAPIVWPPHAKSWLIWKDPDAGKDWGREEKGTTGWAGWMASPTQWRWVWVDSGSWWWTGRPGMLWFMGSQRVGYDWATELNQTKGASEKEITWGRAQKRRKSTAMWELALEGRRGTGKLKINTLLRHHIANASHVFNINLLITYKYCSLLWQVRNRSRQLVNIPLSCLSEANLTQKYILFLVPGLFLQGKENKSWLKKF